MRQSNQVSEAIVPTVEKSNGSNGGIDCYALIELFGHQRIVGKVTQQVVGVAALLRVDVPDLIKNGEVVRKGFTRFYGPSAVYSLTPIDENAVRDLLPMISGQPVKEWEYRFASREEEWDGQER